MCVSQYEVGGQYKSIALRVLYKKNYPRAILVFTVAAVAVAFLQNAPRRLGNKVILTNYNGNECLSAISNGGQL